MASGRAPVILTRIYGYACLVLLVACLTLFGLWQHANAEAARLQAKAGQEQVVAQIAAREVERRHSLTLAEIAEKYEQDKRAADEAQRKLVADLRAGNVRLRRLWQGCDATGRVSGAAASAALADADARLREESAGRIIGNAKRADDWIKRLQEVIRQDRQP